MKIVKLKKESRTFMPEILFPGSGLSPPTNKSIIPTNNVHTIRDVMDGRQYVIPGAGGDWGQGEDLFHSYKSEGDSYKRKERDMDIMEKMTAPQNDEDTEKWKVKIPGGSKTFTSFNRVQQFREKMQEKGVPIKWIARVAQNQNRVQTISNSLKRTFKIESFDTYNSIKETGSAFCVAHHHFITCAHVIVNYDNNVESDIDLEDYKDRLKILIMTNGRRIPAEIVAINASWDVAIVKAEIDVEPFSLDVTSLQVGDDILTIGSPHGFENNTSFGNVGSLGRQIYSHHGAPKHFFIDAPVFQGNSGGPIVKINNGEVVGMLTSVVARSGEYGLNVGLPSSYLQNFCIMNEINVS